MASLVESGLAQPAGRRRRLGRLLPDARRASGTGRLRGLRRPARAAARLVPRPRRGGHRRSASRAGSPSTTQRTTASGSPTSSGRPRSTAAATRCASRRRTSCCAAHRRARPRTSPTAPAAAPRAGPQAREALAEARKYLGTPYRVGRLDAADRLRLLRPRAVGLRQGRHPDPARDRPADPRRERDQGRPQRPAARRPGLLPRRDRLRAPRRHLARRRPLHPRAAHRRRRQDLEPQGVLLRRAVHGRPPLRPGGHGLLTTRRRARTRERRDGCARRARPRRRRGTHRPARRCSGRSRCRRRTSATSLWSCP